MEPWGKSWVLNRGEGYVSVDFRKRSYTPGHSCVYTDGTNKYAGSGWKQRLVDDAINYLEAL